jgi:hypothetical protein
MKVVDQVTGEDLENRAREEVPGTGEQPAAE